MSANTPPNIRLAIFAAAAALGALALLAVGGALAPFLLALIAAYILAPLAGKLTAAGLGRNASAVVCVVLIMLALLLVPVLVLPLLLSQFSRLVDSLPAALDAIQQRLLGFFPDLGSLPKIDLASLAASLAGSGASKGIDFAQAAAGWLGAGAELAFALLLTLVLLPLVAFHLLRDWPAMTLRIRASIPAQFRPAAVEIASLADGVLSEFLRAQLLVMLIMAAVYSLLLAVAGVPYAIAVGVIGGLLVFIPYIGFLFALALALLAATLAPGSWTVMLYAAGAMLFGTSLESFWLTPKIIGERTGLGPVAVLLALTVMGSVFGFSGVLAALPAAAVLTALWRHYYAGPAQQ